MKTNLSTHPKKMSRKELKTPDDFQRIGKAIGQWVSGHPRTIIVIVVLLVAVGVAAAATSISEQHQQAAADDAFSSALHALDRPVGTDSAMGFPEGAKPFASQKDQDTAIVSKLSPVMKKYGNTRAGATAAFLVGEAELREGHNDAAVKAFTQFLAESPVTDSLRAIALEGQGYAYEDAGKLDRALASFEQLETESSRSHVLEGMGLYHQARILIRQNHKEKAAEKLAMVSKRFPDSTAARLAAQKLGLLRAEGVKVPTPAPKSLVMTKASDPGA